MRCWILLQVDVTQNLQLEVYVAKMKDVHLR